MYDDQYGLTGRPFQLTPDPHFWFDTATHRKAMAYLGYGLSQGEGFVVITGDPGAGKTTLVGHLLGEIDRERLNVIKIVSSQIGADDLLRTVCAGLNVDATGAPKAAMLTAIERGLHAVARSGRRTLLIVDEAQALPVDSLEELRMLSNFQAGGYALLQIFLLGQPEFRLALQEPRLDQLRQRVIAMHHLEPMGADEVEPYLIHRLSCVGWRGRPRFTSDAMAAMHRWSGGIPRRLNQLASRVMLFGAVEGTDTFGGPDVAAVIADMESDLRAGARPAPAPAPAPAARDSYELREVVPPAPEPARGEAPFRERRAVDRRIVELERQLKQQDDALRRVLTVLVDWVESGEPGRRPDISRIRDTAA
ncbi:MAG TPA: AAA family ATPase [Sphingomonas sp.]|nr:AAA family ATPase [Sphingomonas sp.]